MQGMQIIFMGTNGWYSSDTGLTPSILIGSHDAHIVLDAGEGISRLDRYIKGISKDVFILISHLHLDHISGLHTLSKFKFTGKVTIIAKEGARDILKKFISPPFTTAIEGLPYPLEIREIREGKETIPPLKIEAALMQHPDPSLTYRLNIDGKVITYATDTAKNSRIPELARGSEILITECSYLPGEENPSWQHMNPESAAWIAREAGAKRLILTHFDALRYRSWEDRSKALAAAKEIFENTEIAYDGMIIEV